MTTSVAHPLGLLRGSVLSATATTADGRTLYIDQRPGSWHR